MTARRLLTDADRPPRCCPNCWQSFVHSDRKALAYCWHGNTLFRTAGDGSVRWIPGTADEHRALAELAVKNMRLDEA